MACYNSGRNQYLKLNHRHSGSQPILCGIAQGPVLEPLVFNLYVNLTMTEGLQCKAHMYAHGLAIYLFADTLKQADSDGILSNDIKVPEERYKLLRMHLNAKQTQALIAESK